MTTVTCAGDALGFRIDGLVGELLEQLAQVARRLTAFCEAALDLSWSVAQWYADLRRDRQEVARAIDALLAMTANVGGLPGKILVLIRRLHDALLAYASTAGRFGQDHG